MKAQKVLTKVVFILLLATLTFIFSNSLEPVAESSIKSQGVMYAVTPCLELFFGNGNVTDHLVRKIAHFTEFGVLGVELMLLAVLRNRVRFQSIANCLFIGLTSAVTDESLQMITDRSPLVKDILLDYTGVITGILFVLLLYSILRSARKNV